MVFNATTFFYCCFRNQNCDSELVIFFISYTCFIILWMKKVVSEDRRSTNLEFSIKLTFCITFSFKYVWFMYKIWDNILKAVKARNCSEGFYKISERKVFPSLWRFSNSLFGGESFGPWDPFQGCVFTHKIPLLTCFTSDTWL